MRDWSDEMIQKTKAHFKEHYGAELSTDDAIESLDNMVALAELLIDWYYKEKAKGNDILTKDG